MSVSSSYTTPKIHGKALTPFESECHHIETVFLQDPTTGERFQAGEGKSTPLISWSLWFITDSSKQSTLYPPLC